MECYRQVHFIGIGGNGMSAIARVLLEKGYQITGSDMSRKDLTDKLAGQGAKVYIGHKPEYVEGADAVVYSTDIPQDNVELVAARQHHIPLFHRSEMLAQILNEKQGIAVAGAHGKTTTSSMIALVFERCGLDPTYMIGGEMLNVGRNARAGSGEYVIAEADESDGSFLHYRPFMAVMTNIEADHLENYGGRFDNLLGAYDRFLRQIKPGGVAILNEDDVHLHSMLPALQQDVLSYSLQNPEADFYATDLRFSERGVVFQAFYQGTPLGEVALSVPGEHNVYNASAALLAGLRVGLGFQEMAVAIQEFRGAKRRFEVIGRAGDVLIVDDYAHHPTEIEATLRAARCANRRVIALFQPHRYTRTDDLKEEFSRAFRLADEVWVTEVYSPAGDVKRATSGRDLVNLIRQHSNPNTFYVQDLLSLFDAVKPRIQPGDMVITMGAGDIWKVAEWLRDQLVQSA